MPHISLWNASARSHLVASLRFAGLLSASLAVAVVSLASPAQADETPSRIYQGRQTIVSRMDVAARSTPAAGRSTAAGWRSSRARRAPAASASSTALQLAARRGLSYSDYGTYVLLEGASLRIRIYPGSSVVVVAGREYRLKDRSVRTRSEVRLSARVTRFLTGKIDRYRSDERDRKLALARETKKLEPLPPLPPLPTRKPIARKLPKVDFKPAARAQADERHMPARVTAAPGWVPPVQERPWKWIILHHSDDESGNLAKYDAFHRNERHWENGCGYHFVIGNGSLSGDGEVEIGPRWVKQLQGAHAKVPGNRYNERGIGICLVGDFHGGTGRPSAAQMNSLVRLVRWLKARYGIEDGDIHGHCECCSTCCPGKNFPWAEFRRRIAN